MDTNVSYLTLRKSLGILGLLLPVLLWVFNGFELKPSISHFYYTSSSTIFTSFLFAFGLLLFSYRGRIKTTETVSDNFLTNIGGLMAIATSFIPTAYCTYCKDPIIITNELAAFCDGNGLTTPFMHNNTTLGMIHLICASLFLILMGYMSFFRFTKGNTSQQKKIFYRFCAIVIWASIGALAIIMIFDLAINENFVFIGECVALVFFGIAWMVKGKTLQRFGL